MVALESALKIQSDQSIKDRLKSLKERIKAKRLKVLLDDGYNALIAGQYEAARDSYKAALDLEPKSEEASTGYEKAAGLLLAVFAITRIWKIRNIFRREDIRWRQNSSIRP